MADSTGEDEKTLTEIKRERLKNYVNAEKKALEAQQFTDGKVQLQRASLRNIRSGIDAIEQSLSGEDGGTAGGAPSFRQVVLKE